MIKTFQQFIMITSVCLWQGYTITALLKVTESAIIQGLNIHKI